MGTPQGGFEVGDGNEFEGGGKFSNDDAPAPSTSGGVAIKDIASPPIDADNVEGGAMDAGEGAIGNQDNVAKEAVTSIAGMRWELNGAGMTTIAISHESFIVKTANDPIHPPPHVHDRTITQSAKLKKSFEGGTKKTGELKMQWTDEEDRKLTEWVKTHGPNKWSEIASILPGESFTPFC